MVPAFFSKINPNRGEVLKQGSVVLAVKYYSLMKRRTHRQVVHITVRVDVKRVVKVKAYKRIRRGKVEKVRSYYRSK